MLHHHRKIFPLLLLIVFQAASAQFPQLHFENITTVQGLSSNEITCIYQDHDGFLWIGTHFGLNRYDGNVVQTFYHDEANANSLSGNDIVDILQDHQNIFWIATKDGGLTRYDPSQMRDKQFIQFKNHPDDKKTIAVNRLNCVYDYSDDYLLIGAEVCTGIFLDKKNFMFKYVQTSSSGKMYIDPAKAELTPSVYQNWIHHISSDDSSIYISFLIGGWVYKIDKQYNLLLKPMYPHGNLAYSIPSFEVDANRIWLAAWSKGIYLQEGFSTDTINLPRQKLAVKLNDEIQSVLSWDIDYLLAGSKSTGLYLVNKNDFSYRNLRHDRSNTFSIASNKVNCIYKDRNGILWIGTTGGISKYDPAEWPFHAELLEADNEDELMHFSTHEDDDGTIRVCTNAGIYKKNPGESVFRLITFQSEHSEVSPTFIFSYNGRNYLCTEDYLYHYSKNNEAITRVTLINFTPTRDVISFTGKMQVRSAFADTVNGHPLIMLGILGDGFGIYDLSDSTIGLMVITPTAAGSIRNNLIHWILKDHEENIWVGTAGGLFRWKKSYPIKNDFIAYLNDPKNDSTISGDNVSGMYIDERNHLWVTTMGNGLNEFDGRSFHHYVTPTSAGNKMLGIYADRHHRYWIPTPQGFEVFDASTKKINEVAVPNPEWILKYPTRILNRKDGAFSYGAGNYLVTFYPDSFHFESNPPKIYLTDFKVMDQSIFQTPEFGDLEFPHGKNFFTINFSSLQVASSNARYLYQLAGLNDIWITAGKEGKATFTSLPAGHYILKVKVTDANGTWSDATDLISFTVLPPYWQQWWFYVLLTILIVGVMALINRVRLVQLSRLQLVRNKIANDLHDDVGSALSTINLYSEVAKMKSGTEQDELKEVLEKISSTSQEMQENMNYIVWSIQPRHDRFDQVVLRMKRYAIDMLQPKNITVNFVLDEHLNSVKLTQEKRKELFLIFKEAIHNITKYAQCETVMILFGRKGNKIVMEISDDGIGFRKEEVVSGNGLYTMQERARTLKGDLKISSRPEAGTRVTLSFSG